MRTPFPNLFVVGAMSSFKEPAFVANPSELATDSRIIAAAGYAGNRDRYSMLFADSGAVRYRGESSTHYTKMPRITGVADRIAAQSPDARIIYLVRDPVERTLSHYRYAVRAREERRPVLEAIQKEPFYSSVSHYAMQIRPYLDRFGADRVQVCELEDLIQRPQQGLADLVAWLGLEPDHEVSFARHNAGPEQVDVVRGPGLLHRAARTTAYRRMRRFVPSGPRDAIRSLLLRPADDSELRNDDAVEYLRRIHEPQTVELEQLLGRRFELWRTLRP